MKWIKEYKKYLETIKFDLSVVNIDINESLSIWYDSLLKSIGAQELDIYDILKLSKKDKIDNLEVLIKNNKFINNIANIGMKNSNIENTNDFETFLRNPCRFVFISKIDSSDLETPNYIILQNFINNKWDSCKIYKVNDNINKFYDKLSSKVIEVEDGDNKYIYNTSNGNEWILQNSDKANNIFKKYLRKDDFEVMIKDNKVKINII
jgi:hypothetical protein